MPFIKKGKKMEQFKFKTECIFVKNIGDDGVTSINFTLSRNADIEIRNYINNITPDFQLNKYSFEGIIDVDDNVLKNNNVVVSGQKRTGQIIELFDINDDDEEFNYFEWSDTKKYFKKFVDDYFLAFDEVMRHITLNINNK
jgi:hypothetical protein